MGNVFVPLSIIITIMDIILDYNIYCMDFEDKYYSLFTFTNTILDI